MPLLKTQKTRAVYPRERVDVPEFGTDENGEVYYVFARALTIAEQKQAMQRATWIDRDARQISFDAVQVTALAAVDGKEGDTGLGSRVFSSERAVGELPPAYEPAIKRISNAILVLSGLIKPARNGATETEGEMDAEPGELLDEAKKD